MGNKIFTAILEEKIQRFRTAFQETSKEIFWDEKNNQLIHPWEFGSYRESVCKDYLRLVVPTRLDIGNWFLINDKGDVSTQCDIVIFDKNSAPLIQDDEKQRFFPIETVCAIGEVKSNLNKTELKEALNKLAKNKMIRENISEAVPLRRKHDGDFNPVVYPYDNIFSFLICNKLSFDIRELPNEIDSYYSEDIKPWQKHNLILSIEDGLVAYIEKNGKTLMYPFVKNEKLKNRLVQPEVNKNIHLYLFSSYIFMATTSNNIFYPEITNYINNFTGGFNFDEK